MFSVVHPELFPSQASSSRAEKKVLGRVGRRINGRGGPGFLPGEETPAAVSLGANKHVKASW